MNDGKVSFDYIEHIVAILVLINFWSSVVGGNHFVFCLTKTIHRIKIEYSVSAPIYGNETVCITSTGQGNGLGLSLWAPISTIIIKMCKEKGHGMNIFKPISKQQISLIDSTFVDKVDLVTGVDDKNITCT